MKSLLYGPLRALHLLLTAAVMPLGVWGALQLAPSMGGVLRLGLFAVGALLALFVLALDQADYPVTAVGALRRTVPLVLNFGLGLWAGEGRVFSAAYWTLSSLLASLAATMAVLVVLTHRSEDPELRAQRSLVLGLLFPVAAVALATLWPLASSVNGSPPVVGAVVGWLVQTVSTTRVWMKQSVFSRARETPEARARAAAMHPWNGPLALAYVGAMVGLIAVLLFTMP